MTRQFSYSRSLGRLAIAGLTAIMVACGGSSDDDDDVVTSGSSPVVARGMITQLGSIYVNGVKYETPNGGSYSDDDSTDSVAAYQVGQVVSIRGRRNDDGVTGVADEVEYEAEIEGMMTGGTIHGITILTTPTTNGPSMSAGIRYEVSGIWINATTLEATFVKVDDDTLDTLDEIKGYVENDTGPTFDVHGITFNWTGMPDVSDGDIVEVHFDTCSGFSPNVTCNAVKVELEDDYFDQAEGIEVEVEGAVDKSPAGCPGEADFRVDGVCVDSSTAEWMDGLTGIGDLVQGSRVEAEGHMVAATPQDYLRADKVKGRGNRVRVTSIAENVVAGPPCTFTLIDSKISVTILDCVNAFEGDASDNNPLTIGNLANEEIEARGVRTGPNSMLALRVKADNLSSGNRHELRAEVDVDGADTTNDTLTVMGLVSKADACTEIEIGDMVVSGDDDACNTTLQGIDDFLTLVDDDTNAINGPRDVVEVGFKITSGNGTDSTPYLAEEWEIEEEDD